MINEINTNLLIKIVCVILIFFIFFIPLLDNENRKDINNSREQFDNINMNFIDQNICSKQCCKFTQWPVPFNTKDPNFNDSDNYIGSNFTCNNGKGGGCVCYTKKDNDYLSNHGQSSNDIIESS